MNIDETIIKDMLKEVKRQYCSEKDHKKIVKLYKIISDWSDEWDSFEHPENLTDNEWESDTI